MDCLSAWRLARISLSFRKGRTICALRCFASLNRVEISASFALEVASTPLRSSTDERPWRSSSSSSASLCFSSLISPSTATKRPFFASSSASAALILAQRPWSSYRCTFESVSWKTSASLTSASALLTFSSFCGSCASARTSSESFASSISDISKIASWIRSSSVAFMKKSNFFFGLPLRKSLESSCVSTHTGLSTKMFIASRISARSLLRVDFSRLLQSRMLKELCVLRMRRSMMIRSP
mmetsp:Transcript_19332/g.73028  ORF Transcript_19332/g.73028 Transcript_19332/m.73028 type:complete len:240 (+) Transcript_19332:4564-5283(+)